MLEDLYFDKDPQVGAATRWKDNIDVELWLDSLELLRPFTTVKTFYLSE